MNNDYSGMFAGVGILFFLLAIVVYLGILALVLWVSYLIMRTAVKNGMLLALRESGQMFAPRQPPAAPPQYPGASGPYA